MESFCYIISDEAGIHARPAGELVQMAKEFHSRIILETGGECADLSRAAEVMALDIRNGMEVVLTAEGSDETEAVSRLKMYFKENF